MFDPDPMMRPTISDIINSDFFKNNKFDEKVQKKSLKKRLLLMREENSYKSRSTAEKVSTNSS